MTPDQARRCELWELCAVLELDVDDAATEAAAHPDARPHPIFKWSAPF